MARPRKTNAQTNGSPDKADGVAPYFRPIFMADRQLLKIRSNKQLLDRWLADHPTYTTVPENVKSGLANLKSVLRKSLRKHRGRKAAAAAATAGTVVAANKAPSLLSNTVADSKLEKLEMLIDDCLTMAKILDREGLDSVIKVLRRARNAVVWKLGGEE